MKLVVMIPCFNEEKTIAELIKRIPKKIKGISQVNILVINDGSTDSTIKEAAKAKADKIISHYPNKGLGVTFRKGLEEALKMGADVIVNIDADLQFNPEDIPIVAMPVIEGKADMCTASRFAVKELEPKMPLIKKFGNKFFTKALSLLLNKKFTDTQCGFRAYSKEAALRMNLFGKFTYTQEAFISLANKEMKISEVPIKVRGEREHGKSKIVKSWWNYGLKSSIIILRSIVDSRPLKFFGTLGAITFLIGFIPGLWLFIRWTATKVTHPYSSLITFSATCMIIGFLLIILALLSDLIDRQKKLVEESIYLQKKAMLIQK
jgi:glycosyltransferase involved in cell wall biosynthesis